MPDFNIRAEFPENLYEDFKVGAEDLEQARVRAESRIRMKTQPENRASLLFDWRGQVVFVRHD